MVSSRWHRVCVLLLAVWLLADAASFALCDPQPLQVACGPTRVNAGHQANPVSSTDNPCLCCSHGAEIAILDVHVSEVSAASVHLAPPSLADISPRRFSPPPRS